MSNQAVLTLLEDGEEQLKLGLDKVTARSCEFICSAQQADFLRDGDEVTGRYKAFQTRLLLYPQGDVGKLNTISIQGRVISVRRHAQDSFCVIMHFNDVSAEGYRLIAEHATDSLQTELQLVRQG